MMADIELVIKIPEGLKKDFELEQWTALSCMEMKNALEKATPLPKGHGRLIDEKDILDTENNDGGWYDLVDMPEYIAGVKAIIEADKED